MSRPRQSSTTAAPIAGSLRDRSPSPTLGLASALGSTTLSDRSITSRRQHTAGSGSLGVKRSYDELRSSASASVSTQSHFTHSPYLDILSIAQEVGYQVPQTSSAAVATTTATMCPEYRQAVSMTSEISKQLDLQRELSELCSNLANLQRQLSQYPSESHPSEAQVNELSKISSINTSIMTAGEVKRHLNQLAEIHNHLRLLIDNRHVLMNKLREPSSVGSHVILRPDLHGSLSKLPALINECSKDSERHLRNIEQLTSHSSGIIDGRKMKQYSDTRTMVLASIQRYIETVDVADAALQSKLYQTLNG
ncbi:hypothetical protein GQ42DRAFT_160161 [Ramicandelaber brevisporus]|nr:hypothetical protein GQ42DRAFT_160161 [Ramicandelaber brevisporus]